MLNKQETKINKEYISIMCMLLTDLFLYAAKDVPRKRVVLK